jgi:undecaprenyl-diphosphatase
LNSILELDARLTNQMRVAEKPGALRALAIFFAHSGDSWFWAIGLFAIWISGDSFWKEWAVVQFASISLLAAMVLVVKFRIRRKRPEGEWGRIYRLSDPHSFPSGHAARAFLIATIAAGLGPAWLAIGLWIWAPVVALARVAMGVHFLSDIVAGALFGILIAWIGLQIYLPIFNFLGFTLW